MVAAILIIILILGLSIVLFFVIKKFSHVKPVEHDIYAEEGSIADFQTISQDRQEIFDNMDTENTRLDKIKLYVAMTMSKLYTIIRNQVKKVHRIADVYKKNQQEKRKKYEAEIQEAIKRDQALLDAENQRKAINDIDTSVFEDPKLSTPTKSVIQETETPQTDTSEEKATDFVEQLLSDTDGSEEVSASGGDISDTYYYEYMEKRYIDRIVANSKDIEAYKKLGELYVDIKNYTDALEAFTYVVKLKPSDTIANRRIKDLSNRLKRGS